MILIADAELLRWAQCVASPPTEVLAVPGVFEVHVNHAIQRFFAAWAMRCVVFRNTKWDRVRLIVHFRSRRGDPAKSTGEAFRCQNGSGRILVRVGDDFADALATLLHEMAHIAAWPEGDEPHHSRRWRLAYTAACLEVTGVRVSPDQGQCRIDRAVREAMRERYIKTSETARSPTVDKEIY